MLHNNGAKIVLFLDTTKFYQHFCDKNLFLMSTMSHILYPVATSRGRIAWNIWNRAFFSVPLHQVFDSYALVKS